MGKLIIDEKELKICSREMLRLFEKEEEDCFATQFGEDRVLFMYYYRDLAGLGVSSKDGFVSSNKGAMVNLLLLPILTTISNAYLKSGLEIDELLGYLCSKIMSHRDYFELERDRVSGTDVSPREKGGLDS